ncbi:MAG: bifunctional adenosylcobinamide kinase/adenosylcobinamide-phosphate guanylyltransferase [Caryophanon sp.]|nr:bifunctional adenosylcobinamide kinase/adenosylcobinamide-phosphate guanylyltransferase [Caryophanon sp.]
MIFITGGVRSGKSAFAEKIAIARAEHMQLPRLYAATSVAFDAEMQTRITHHQQDRANDCWETLEVPYDVTRLCHTQHVVLFECVTTWLSNVLYKEPQRVDAYIAAFKQMVVSLRGRIVIVSNEVLFELVSPYAETERYKRLLGELHQWLVAESEAAYECTFSHVTQWKGASTCKDFY